MKSAKSRVAISTDFAVMLNVLVSIAVGAYATHCWTISCMTQPWLEPTHLYDSPFPATVLIAILFEAALCGPSAACWAAQIHCIKF